MTPAWEAELLERVAATPAGELRSLVRSLDLARDAAILRLLEPQSSRLLTPQDAAQLVSLPERRLRSLARGKAWALRIGGSLRIEEAALLSWARERSQRAGKSTKAAARGARDVQGAQQSVRIGGGDRLRTVKR
jgi:helix-turn-helix protein